MTSVNNHSDRSSCYDGIKTCTTTCNTFHRSPGRRLAQSFHRKRKLHVKSMIFSCRFFVARSLAFLLQEVLLHYGVIFSNMIVFGIFWQFLAIQLHCVQQVVRASWQPHASHDHARSQPSALSGLCQCGGGGGRRGGRGRR